MSYGNIWIELCVPYEQILQYEKKHEASTKVEYRQSCNCDCCDSEHTHTKQVEVPVETVQSYTFDDEKKADHSGPLWKRKQWLDYPMVALWPQSSHTRWNVHEPHDEEDVKGLVEFTKKNFLQRPTAIVFPISNMFHPEQVDPEQYHLYHKRCKCIIDFKRIAYLQQELRTLNLKHDLIWAQGG